MPVGLGIWERGRGLLLEGGLGLCEVWCECVVFDFVWFIWFVVGLPYASGSDLLVFLQSHVRSTWVSVSTAACESTALPVLQASFCLLAYVRFYVFSPY